MKKRKIKRIPVETEDIKTQGESQLLHDIENAIYRYGQESDLTVFEVVGALEAAKLNLLGRLGEHFNNQK